MNLRRLLIPVIIPLTLITVAIVLLQFIPREEIPLVSFGENTVQDVVWSPDGSQLAVARRGVVLINADTEAVSATLQTDSDTTTIATLAWSPDGTQIAASSEIREIVHVWDVASGEVIHELPTASTDIILGLEWSPDGVYLAGSSVLDNMLHIWNPATGDGIIAPQMVMGGYLYAIDWTPHRNRLVMGMSGRVVVVNPEDARMALNNFMPPSQVEFSAVAWSPDGNFIAAGSHNGQIFVWNVPTGETIYALDVHENLIIGVDWHPEGRYLASASYDGTVRVWDISAGGNQVALFDAEVPLTAVAWSPDGTRLAYSGSSETAEGGLDIVTVDLPE